MKLFEHDCRERAGPLQTPSPLSSLWAHLPPGPLGGLTIVFVVADNERSSREMKPKDFLHSYRPPTPETYRLMLGSNAAQPKARSGGHLNGVHEPTSKRQKTGDQLLKRVRSLVCPLQVGVCM